MDQPLPDQTLRSRETVDTLCDIAQLLGTGLDRELLVLCVKLCEMGANPEALASVVQELQHHHQAVPRS
ncbi:Mitotic-spindle organizing protein 1 [Dimargaris xerosporica]|nr:Mitotic-spindle organizing protein 1 [Dimargaris xerosporica]